MAKVTTKKTSEQAEVKETETVTRDPHAEQVGWAVVKQLNIKDFSRIKAINLYGDRYRVNVMGRGDKHNYIVDSQFVRRCVDGAVQILTI